LIVSEKNVYLSLTFCTQNNKICLFQIICQQNPKIMANKAEIIVKHSEYQENHNHHHFFDQKDLILPSLLKIEFL
jgi:hypothetical protein